MKFDGLSILLVNDNPSDATSMQTMIAEASAGTYQAEYVTRLETALTCLQESSFDAIVLCAASTQLLYQLVELRLHIPAMPIVAIIGGEDNSHDLRPVLPAGAYAFLSRRRLASHTLLGAIHTAIER